MPNLAGFNADSSGEYRMFINSLRYTSLLVTVLGDRDASEVETTVQLLEPLKYFPADIDTADYTFYRYGVTPYDLRIHESGELAIIGGSPYAIEFLESHTGAPGDISPVESHPVIGRA